MRAGDWVGLVGPAEWPARNRSEDRPLHAERIRRSWAVKECAAMGPVVGVGPGGGEKPHPSRGELQRRAEVGVIRPADPSGAQKARAVRVWGRAGRGTCGYR